MTCRIVERLGNQLEVASVSAVHVNPESIALLKRDHVVEGIDRADGGSSQGDHNGSDIAAAQLGFQRFHVHAPKTVGWNGRVLQLEHERDSLVRVVRLLGAENPASWRQ